MYEINKKGKNTIFYWPNSSLGPAIGCSTGLHRLAAENELPDVEPSKVSGLKTGSRRPQLLMAVGMVRGKKPCSKDPL